MLQYFLASSLLALVALSLSRSSRMMNRISIAHSAAYLAISLYALLYAGLPEYFSAEQHLFLDHVVGPKGHALRSGQPKTDLPPHPEFFTAR